MTYDRFERSMFELADQWTTTVDPAECVPHTNSLRPPRAVQRLRVLLLVQPLQLYAQREDNCAAVSSRRYLAFIQTLKFRMLRMQGAAGKGE